MEKAKAFSCSQRSITVTNDKLLKKTEKIKLASRNNTGLFAQILLLSRRKLKHRGIQLIKPGDKDWLELKEPCKLATEFCNEFQIGLKEGYRIYLEIGLGMMQKYSIYKLKSIHAAICNRFEAQQEIERDKTPNKTEAIYLVYRNRILEKVGYCPDYKLIPEKYVFFLKAKEEANFIGMEFSKFIESQFAALEWANGVPDPMQLVGTKAKDRATKFAYENDIRLGKTSGVSKKTINYKSIKGAHKNHRRK